MASVPELLAELGDVLLVQRRRRRGVPVITKASVDEELAAEILEGYELLGLTTPDARSEFTRFAPKGERLQFDIVTSTSSQPFDR